MIYKQLKVNQGDYIRQNRQELDISQKDFAKMLHISTRTLRRYEKGVTVPNSIVYNKMLHLFKNNDIPNKRNCY